MEPNQQMEIQLGHMCNNRCVFCVSGQRTAMREAFPLEADPILERIREQHAAGMRKLTLLGGEPTIQPEFMNILRYAVKLGFDEIVLFTNGVKTSRATFVDEILETGGNYTFRFSFQGATRAAHELTTKKSGSFNRLVESMKNVHARGQRLTVNMCVVTSNYESVADFPALILPYEAKQLHLDMVRPKDSGVRTEQELRDMIPRYSAIVPYFEKMVAGFPEGFDVNIGNFPYCLAPQLARWIHHDGEKTITIAVDGNGVGEGWDKYENKKSDKVKTERCAECVFDAQCSGVYDRYAQFHGVAELVPVTAERLRELDPDLAHFFTMHFEPLRRRLDGFTPPAPFGAPAHHVNSRDHFVEYRYPSPAGDVVIAFRKPGGGVAGTDRFSMHLVSAPDAGRATVQLLRDVFARLTRTEDGLADPAVRVLHPVGDDAAFLGVNRPGGIALVDPRLIVRLRQLRQMAPFGQLAWSDLAVRGAGREAALTFADPTGATVQVTLAVKGAQVVGGYQLGDPQAKPSVALVEGLRGVMGALRGAA